MADQITLTPTRMSSLRSSRGDKNDDWKDNWKQAQNEEHALAGYDPDGLHRYRSLLSFGLTAANLPLVKQITKAELHVFTAGDHPGLKTQKTGDTNLKAAVKNKQWAAAGGGEKVWTGDLTDGGAEFNNDIRAYGHVSDVALHENIVNVLPLVEYWAPTGIRDHAGKACKGKPNYGMVLAVAGDADVAGKHETVVASMHHVDTSIRPFLVLTVVLDLGPGTVTTTGPSGDIPAGTPQFFEGFYDPGERGDQIDKVEIQYRKVGATKWEVLPKWDATNTEVATSTFSVPVPASWPLATNFEWAARVYKGSGGNPTAWSATNQIRWVGNPPTISTLVPVGSLNPSLVSVPFKAIVHVLVGQFRAARWRVQLRTRTVSTDPNWGTDVLWDTGPMTVPLGAADLKPATVILDQTISTLYGGPLLAAGDYSWRAQPEDPYGALGPWKYGDLSLTAPYVPDPGATEFLTGYGKTPPFRIRIFGMGPGRGPGNLVAEIIDASNVGASEYYNSPGEFYFTLPAIHPQVSEIEPYQRHYALEQATEQGWHGIAHGLITDFDATEDQVVFYGTDYLGLLARALEERFDPTNAELPTDKGGAKYVKRTISYIINDQLTKAKAIPNSPVGFISVGDIATISESITIYASFKQRLPFIAGLIESARAGTGRRTRLVCERNPNGTFRWRLLADPGIDRPNLKLEYGGLVQGFRTIPFSTWGTSVAAIGRTVLGTKVYSAISVAPGISETTYGHWPAVTMFSDIDDLSDIRRRADQAALHNSKVGKMMGIALRVGALQPKDGWDIADSVLIDIKRGVVDTSRFGSGYWTIWGWSWNSAPDGHSGLVLSLSPREDKTAPKADLIASRPILSDQTNWSGSALGAYVWKAAKPGTPPTGQAQLIAPPMTRTANALLMSTTDAYGVDQTPYLGTIRLGDTMFVDDTQGNVLRLTVTGTPIDHGTYWEFPSDAITGSEAADQDPVAGSFSPAGLSEGGGGTIIIPDTDPLPTLPSPLYPPGTLVSWRGGLYLVSGDGSTWVEQGGAGGAIDIIPPEIPVIKSTKSVTVVQDDGSSYTALEITVGYATLPSGLVDLAEFVVEGTRWKTETDPPADDWTRAQARIRPSVDLVGTDTVIVLTPTTMGVTYALRAAAIDVIGNRSVWSPVVRSTSGVDNEAPRQVSNIRLQSGMSTAGLRWDAVTAPDFAYTEVQYRTAAFGGLPEVIADPDHVPPIEGLPALPPYDAGNWVSVRVATTVVVISGLANGDNRDPKAVEFRLRSVDASGNTMHQTGTDADGPTYEVVKVDDHPDSDEKGWVIIDFLGAPLVAKPTPLPGNTLLWNEAIIEDVFAGAINATWITSGALRVGNAPPVSSEDVAGDPRIEVYDADGNLVGRWSTDGIEVMDPANDEYKLVITDAGLTIWSGVGTADEFPNVRLTPLGIDAASITFGSMRGGHNLVQNSSFEMGQFTSATVKNSGWDVLAEFNAGRVGADVNLIVGATSITMTTI